MSFQRILIVDDYVPMRQSLKAYLGEVFPHAHIQEAQNGRHALDTVAADPPDVILMDAAMPHVDGIEATRQIKAQWPKVRIIALVMNPRQRKLALDAGADACLFKGCSSEELLSAIHATAKSGEGAGSQAEGGTDP